MSAGRTSFFLGAALGALVTGFVLTAGGALASSGSGAAQGAAKHTSKVVFENDRVRVKDVTFQPGVTDTGMHTHDLPHVGVILSQGALTFTEPGKPSETVRFQAGAVGYREANVTHGVANPGQTPMRVIEVELK